MAERSEKLTERVPLNFTEQQLLDLSRMANLEELSVPEFLRKRVVLPYMYGNVQRINVALNEITSGFGGLGGPEK